MPERAAKLIQTDNAFKPARRVKEPAGELFLSNALKGDLLQRKADCACGGDCPGCQAKSANPSISQPDDESEKEADLMADKIMRMPIAEPLNFSSTKNILNRKCGQSDEEEETQIQKKESSAGESSTFVPPIVDEVINSSTGKSLDAGTRSFMESRFNYDFSRVKIHDDKKAAESAGSINALAYTSGNSIVFNSEQYNPNSDAGKRLLAHELTHVVQQGAAPGLETVQRNTADEHNLQSENFSGDEVLEACFDGETPAFLRIGKRGEPVRKLQNALLQLGFELPEFGADGIFKNETDRAVRKFQRDFELSADGVVGPITIGKMDELLTKGKSAPPNPQPFPPEPPPPNQACAVDNPGVEPTIQAKREIQRAVSPIKKQARTTQKTIVQVKTQAPVIQRKHLDIRESIDEFSKKVNSSVAADPKVTSRGQFYWSELALELIMTDINRAFTFLNPIPGKVSRLISAITANNTSEINKLMKEIPSDIENSGVSNAPDLIKMFLPTSGVESPDTLWAKFQKQGQVPSDFAAKHKNFFAFQELRQIERSACFSMAQFVMNRFQKQGGYTDIDSSKKGKTKPSFSVGVIASATRNFDWVGSKTKGDIVSYNASLPGTITKIKAAIDDGFTLHARVVSGVNFGTGLSPAIKAGQIPPAPKPSPISGAAEHSLVIIGFDDASDKFVFWDPDSSVSRFRGDQGFGILFFNNGRFTTAEDDNDLPVNEDGQHSSGNKRYQVLSVTI